jgi:hypothetical protein
MLLALHNMCMLQGMRQHRKWTVVWNAMLEMPPTTLLVPLLALHVPLARSVLISPPHVLIAPRVSTAAFELLGASTVPLALTLVVQVLPPARAVVLGGIQM